MLPAALLISRQVGLCPVSPGSRAEIMPHKDPVIVLCLLGIVDPVGLSIHILTEILCHDGRMLQGLYALKHPVTRALYGLKGCPGNGVDYDIRLKFVVYRIFVYIKLCGADSGLQPVSETLRDAEPELAVAVFFRIEEFRMSRLLCIGLMGKAAPESILKGHIRQLFKPIGSEGIQLFPEHLLIVGDHVILCNALSQFPIYPLREFLRHGLPGYTACLGYCLQIFHLGIRIQHPDIRLYGAAYDLTLEFYPGVPFISVPFLFGHELKEELIYLRPPHIQKMPSSYIKGGSVHFPAPA